MWTGRSAAASRMESASSGLLAGINLARIAGGKSPLSLPLATMLGALSHYISDETVADFQPMGANMGILPPLEERVRDKQQRYLLVAERAVKCLRCYLDEVQETQPEKINS